MKLALEFSKQDTDAPVDRATFLETIQGARIEWKNLAGSFNATMVRSGRPSRTPNSLRNRVFRMARAEAKLVRGDKKTNLCRFCGQPKAGHVCLVKTNPLFGALDVARDVERNGMDD